MTAAADSLPQDVVTLQALVLTERAARLAAESEAKLRALLIEKLKYTIAKLRHQQFGQSSERGAILGQLELQLSELQENASEVEAAQLAAAKTKIKVQCFERCRPARRPLPEHLPRERVVYSPDRSGKHPEEHLASYAGLMQADAYSGFNRLYQASRRGGPIVEASCWAHARRKLFDLARINKAPIAVEVVERIDALFAIEREINGKTSQERKRVRNERSRPLVAALETWLREQRRKLSARNEIAKAIQYSLNRWTALTRFLDDGRLCMSNNAAERALRGIAVGRRNWTFAGSDEGGRRAAAIYTLVETAKLNDVDPQAWLTDVLARLQDHPAKRIDEFLPWNWKRLLPQKAAA